MKKIIKKLIIIRIVIGCIPIIHAHGYVEQPASRSYACKLDLNTNCGDVKYDAQSLEAPSGRFLSGELDQIMGSVGHSRFKQLDEQTPTLWHKTNVQKGWQNFKWVFTANHKTDYFKFYITKQGWDPNQKLVIADFDKVPLKCDPPVPSWKAPKQPPMDGLNFDCMLPERTGYQVIMAVWKVNDTANSFYNLIDVKYPGDIKPSIDNYPNNIGSINADRTLKVGDQVWLTTHKASESPEKRKLLVIHNADEGAATTWAYNFATSINNTYNGELKAGIKGSEEQGYAIKPVRGNNSIYAEKDSGYTSATISFEHGTIEKDVAKLVDLQSEYPSIKGNPVPISFAIISKANKNVNAVIEITTHAQTKVKTISVDILPGEKKPINFKLAPVTKREMYHIHIQYFIKGDSKIELKGEEYGMFYVKAPQDIGGTFKTKLIGSIQYYQVDNTEKPPKNLIPRNWHVTYNLGDLNLSNNPIIVNAWNNGFNLAKAVTCPYPRLKSGEVTYKITGTVNEIKCEESHS